MRTRTTRILLALLLGLIAAGLGAAPKPTLSVICFQGYTEDLWVKPFEQKYNCTVKITYAGTVDEMFTKVKAAPDAYNIVSIDSGRVKLYLESGLIKPVDVTKLKNYNRIGAFFRDHPYNKLTANQKYHVPIVWGTQTITINTARVNQAALAKYLSRDKRSVSLDILTAPEFKGKTAFFDESTNVVCIAGIHVGSKTPFTFKPNEWDQVANKLYQWKKNARTFTSGLDSEFAVLTSEDAQILLGGNDAILNVRLAEAGVKDEFTQYPMTEGTICWLDGWVITKPTSPEVVEIAHAYIDYMIGDQGQKELAQLIGFGIVNPAGAAGFNPVILDPTSTWWYGQDIQKFPVPLYIMTPEEDPGKRVELWNRVKARP